MASAESLTCSLKQFDRVSGDVSVISEHSVELAQREVDQRFVLGDFMLRYRVLGDTQLLEHFDPRSSGTVLHSKAQNGVSFYGMQMELEENLSVECQLHAENMKGFVGDYLKRRMGLHSLQVYSSRLARADLLSDSCRYAGLLEAFLHERSYHWYDMLFYFEKSFREKQSGEDGTSDPWLEVSFTRMSQECSKPSGDLSVLKGVGQKLVEVFERVQSHLLADKLHR